MYLAFECHAALYALFSCFDANIIRLASQIYRENFVGKNNLCSVNKMTML